MLQGRNYTYETKCRRCGQFEEWHVGTPEELSFDEFLTYMSEKIMFPISMKCKCSARITVQDIISFTDDYSESEK